MDIRSPLHVALEQNNIEAFKLLYEDIHKKENKRLKSGCLPILLSGIDTGRWVYDILVNVAVCKINKMQKIAHWTIPLRFGIDFGKMGLSTSINNKFFYQHEFIHIHIQSHIQQFFLKHFQDNPAPSLIHFRSLTLLLFLPLHPVLSLSFSPLMFFLTIV